MSTHIRPSVSSDFSNIETLLKDNNLPTTDLSVAKPDFWVATDGASIIACVGIEKHGHWGILRSLAVADAHKGKGLGKSMYHEALNGAVEQGITVLYLLTQTAERFFTLLGWEKTERHNVPAPVAASTEFAGVCPSSATCMRLSVKPIMASYLFSQGFNCAQSVLVPFAVELGLEKSHALKLATGFGAGIALRGDICGAVSGGIMALGLAKGRCEASDTASRDLTYTLVHELMEQFGSSHGSTTCKHLLGVDPSTPEGLEQAKTQNLFGLRCPHFVRHAAEIVESLTQKR